MTKFSEHVALPDSGGGIHVQTHEWTSMPPVTLAMHVPGAHVQTYLPPEGARELAAHLVAAAEHAEAKAREGVAA